MIRSRVSPGHVSRQSVSLCCASGRIRDDIKRRLGTPSGLWSPHDLNQTKYRLIDPSAFN